jgi:hypothetical protein
VERAAQNDVYYLVAKELDEFSESIFINFANNHTTPVIGL